MPEPSASPPRSPDRSLLTVLFVGVFMAALDTAVIGPAIPALRAAFGVDNRQIGLVTIVFVLGTLPATALLANLGDRYGRRPVYLASVACFAAGSLLVAVSGRFWMILAGRVLQGIGNGGIVPSASALIGDAFAPERRGKLLGLVGAIYGMAFVVGPPLAALLMVVASWHWIFLLNLPIAAAVLYLGSRALPARRPSVAMPRLDGAGIVVVFVLLISLVLGITRALEQVQGVPHWPWFLALAAAMTATLVVVERRAAQPVVPIALFARRQLSIAYLLTVGSGFGMGAVAFLTSIATMAHGLSAEHAGFALLPLVLCSMAGSMASGRMLHVQGPRMLILAGFALQAIGYAGTALPWLGLWGFLASTAPVGLGVGIIVGGALRTIAIDEAPVAVRGAAQGLINICSSIGTLLSAAAIGAVADFNGGGAEGFAIAYAGVAILMVAMLLLSFTLRRDTAAAPEEVDQARALSPGADR